MHDFFQHLFLKSPRRMVFGMVLSLFLLLAKVTEAQDLVLQNVTVTSSQVFTATRSITAGPEFTVTATGSATLNAPNVAMKPRITVVAGGQLYVVSQNTIVNVDDGQRQTEPIPGEFYVARNYPNPFNPETRIRYGLPQAAEVEIAIFNALGHRVRTLLAGRQPAGQHVVVWDGTDDLGQRMPSGLYFYRIRAGERVQTRKMLLVQ